MASPGSAIGDIGQDTVEDDVQDILDEILDYIDIDDIDEADEDDASEMCGCAPSIPYDSGVLWEETASCDKAELRKRVAAVIACVDNFCASWSKAKAGAVEDDDAKSETDMLYSGESTTPVSSGLRSPLVSDAPESDTSYSEEPSFEFEELTLEGPTTTPHHLAETSTAAGYGEIPLEHLANPEKYTNQYIEVKKSKLGGNGVFSKIDLKGGQLILAERPQIVACPDTIYTELEKLAPEVRDAFLRMHAHKRSPDQEERQAIFLTNAFAIQEHSCVYMIASRFNHACPNVRLVNYRVVSDRVMEFRVMKDVPAGTELTISYGPLTPRQLYSMWGFRCACGGCRPISDEEVARINRAINARGIW